MSTFSQNVQKVKDAFAAIKTALAGKGVTVPSDAKLSDVPALVDGISAGTPALCTFELTYTGGTKTVETTSEGVVRLSRRFYYRQDMVGCAVSIPGAVAVATDGDASAMFYQCSGLVSLSLPTGFGDAITSAGNMFYGCSSLAAFDAPAGFCSRLQSAASMFSELPALASFTAGAGSFSETTKASQMFYGCSSLATVTLGAMFGEALTTADQMFTSCSALTRLEFPAGSGKRLTYSPTMFYNCSKLTSLVLHDGFGGSITNADSMFGMCKSLRALELPTGFGAAIEDATRMFWNCTSLKSLALPVGFGSSITTATDMFTNCTALATISAPAGVTIDPSTGENGVLRMKVSFSLSGTNLNKASLIVVLNSLQQVSGQTLTLGTRKSRLTGDDGAAAISAAESKGWTIV
jgi:hypothetical protein